MNKPMADLGFPLSFFGRRLEFVTQAFGDSQKLSKGQLISKANCQAEDSPKKRTNEFVFTTVRRVFVRFLGESSA